LLLTAVYDQLWADSKDCHLNIYMHVINRGAKYACSLDNKLMNCSKFATLLRVRNSSAIAKHPTLTELSGASVSCSFCRRDGTLINLHDVSWTADLFGVGPHPVDAQVAVHVEPVGEGSLCANVEPCPDRCLADVVVRPEVGDLQ